MHIELSDEQAMLRETTRGFLAKESSVAAVRALIEDPAGFDQGTWRRAAELGLPAMLVAEQFGGIGSDEPIRDASIIAEELGRLIQPGPFLPGAIVAFAVANFGTDELRDAVLPGLVTGEQTAAWCLAEADHRWDPDTFTVTAEARGSGYVLHTTKDLVQDASTAHYFLITARAASGPVQIVLPAQAPGITVAPLGSLDLTRRFSRVRFEDVEVPAGAVLGGVPAGEQWRRQFDLAVVLHCAETVGLMERIFEMTLEYANDRFAFGRPIGSFQAIKHMCADMFAWLESSKAISSTATDAVHAGNADAALVVSTAKAYVGAFGSRLVEQCLQVFGGIGYTWEHDLHFYLRRAKSNEVLYGTPDWHRERLCQLMGMTAESGADHHG
ncbi:hypothetical protein ACG83_30770 [Frankia sp. R43]|uniref:acyl-CoA dehydrogenase family protein n=1 Tax=Frankia sp. R43 TaxID=269536 RepID=UPI0006CA1659|nr:acyl-CoA dehydrogenase [Frankia sp. R43]KPM51962.1 hypothetical protein ACG83_30770 [Frankia sp. R43]